MPNLIASLVAIVLPIGSTIDPPPLPEPVPVVVIAKFAPVPNEPPEGTGSTGTRKDPNNLSIEEMS